MAQNCCIHAMVRIFLHQIVKEYTDPYTGVINCTMMAEEAVDQFDLWGPAPEYAVPEWVYDYAAEVAEQHEEAQCSSSM